MWDASKHSDDENARWSHLRAIEWVYWPFFLSQPVVPVVLYFFDWWVIFGALAVVGFLWRAIVVPCWVSPSLAFFGPIFVRLKFVAAPLMAYLLWNRGETTLALVAFVWPWIGPFAVQFVMALPQAILELTPLGKASQIGQVQTRFLLALGYDLSAPPA